LTVCRQDVPITKYSRCLLPFGALFVLAFVVRIAAALAWEWRFGHRLVFGDSESYWHLARSLAHGEPYRFGEFGTVFRMPGYPALLAPLFWFFDEPPTLAVRIEGCLLGAIAVLLAVLWTRQLFGNRAGWFAGLIMTFHPEMVLSSVLILSEAAFLPFWIAHLFGLSVVLSNAMSHDLAQKKAAGFMLGCLAGLTTLIRPVTIVWLPFLATIMVLFSKQRRGCLAFWGISFLGFAAMMFPWWLRNYWVTGQWVLTTTQAGPTLYDGLHPTATGASDMTFVPQKFNELRQRMPDTRNIDLELEFNRWLASEALRWAWSHPQRMVKLAVVKFRRLWNPCPNDPGFNVFPINAIVGVGFAVILGLALAGLIKFRAMSWSLVGCWLPVIYVTVLHMVFVASIRYRWPALPGLIVLSAGFLAVGVKRSEHQSGRLGLG